MKEVANRLTEFVQTHLPTAQALQISVADYDSHSLTLTAPLGPSVNDKQTAFGGSLYVVAVMAGWGMVYLRCREAGIDPNIVVARGEIDYHAPVDSDIVVSSLALEETEWQRFLGDFKTRGKAKIELSTQVLRAGKPAVSFKGLYAIIGHAADLT
ncbi:MAG: thioesterase domain-containing protein [Bermanella sp.]|jgi:thioesterase domain-containing protein